MSDTDKKPDIDTFVAEHLKRQEELVAKINEHEWEKKWLEEAKNMTVDKLPAFIKSLVEFQHHYGTIPRAIGVAAYAAAMAVENSPTGGITGFQAGFVSATFLRAWHSIGDKPFSRIHYEDMLFPQYGHLFTTIPRYVWEWLQTEANNLLKSDRNACEAVRRHWQTIADGNIPFGLTIRE